MTSQRLIRLEVRRRELLRAVLAIRRHSRKRPGKDAILRFADGQFQITLDGLTLTIPATGRWPRPVRVTTDFLHTVALLPPQEDPVGIRITGGFIEIGTTSMPYMRPRRIHKAPGSPDIGNGVACYQGNGLFADANYRVFSL